MKWVLTAFSLFPTSCVFLQNDVHKYNRGCHRDFCTGDPHYMRIFIRNFASMQVRIGPFLESLISNRQSSLVFFTNIFGAKAELLLCTTNEVFLVHIAYSKNLDGSEIYNINYAVVFEHNCETEPHLLRYLLYTGALYQNV